MRKGITKLVKNPDGTLTREYDMQKIIGQDYNELWYSNLKGIRYVVVCGSRSSKKSYNLLGYMPILMMLEDPDCNILFVRRYDTDLRQSCMANIQRCIADLGLEHLFNIRMQPLQVELKSTGQLMLFRGISNPSSLSSLSVPHGYIKSVFFEEFYEVESEQSFNMVDQSIRSGASYDDDGNLVENNVDQHIYCIFNPWTKGWQYDKFFKNNLEPNNEILEKERKQIYVDKNWVGPYGVGLALGVMSYRCNEFRNKSQVDVAAEEMKKKNYDYYATVFLGQFGAAGSTTYPELSDKNIITQTDLRSMPIIDWTIGIDTGLSAGEGKKKTVKRDEDAEKKVRSATAMILGGVTQGYKKLVVVDEYFHSNDPAFSELNSDNRDNKTIIELADACLDKIAEWINIYGYGINPQTNNNLYNSPSEQGYGALMKGTARIYIDSADIGFRSILEMKAKERKMFNLEFYAATKRPIRARIDFTRLLLSYGDFLITKECKNLLREMKNAHADKDGSPRANIDDHCCNAAEYQFSLFMPSFSAWKTAFGGKNLLGDRED